MSGELQFPDADLRAHAPRSPFAQIAGLVFMARTVDKLRAKIQGTLGAYKIGPGISIYLFEYLGVTEEQMIDVVRGAKGDDGVAEWLRANTDTTRYPEHNEKLMTRGIRDAEHRAAVLPNYPVLAEHPDMPNWFEIFVLDDAWMFRAEAAQTAT